MTEPVKRSYKDTLNLPKTSFAMKANLVQNEPASQKRWAAAGLYEKLRAAGKSAPRGRFVFHDGPPYANGSIHLGHLLNKVLKDFVVRSRTLMGFDVPYTPGWDCHGLPIEHKVMQDLGPAGRELEAYKIRRKCQDSAEKFIKLQKTQMQRLLTVADYDHPYVTMDKGYEGAVLDVFADLVGKGLVYRALKPVHWSIENRTALAEAELEYYDRQDTSVYVLLEVTNHEALPAAFKTAGLKPNTPVHLMIWTTTPWTLPANLAVAVHPRYDYGLFRFQHAGQTRHAILARELGAKVLAAGGAADVVELATCPGAALDPVCYAHPFAGRVSPVVMADYVTLEDGTGLVHTAPGHGVEDYQTGKKYGLDIYCPVKADGTFDETVPQWLRAPGVDVWKANTLVVDNLRGSGHLFHDHQFTHSYPHDWRGKTPTIFRATEQWFISVDREFEGGKSLRQRALAAAEKGIAFHPAWGQNRLRGMLESRPDWCISRQRAWGLPIPAFFPPEGVEGEPLLTAASIKAVVEVIRQQGSDAWFKLSPADLLAHYNPTADHHAPAWVKSAISSLKSEIRKGSDIFDVWFESGCSWNGALKRMQEGNYPAELYLEGSDQHRGWFQVSLLCGLAVTGQPPFRGLVTHGFTVDKDGRKMSKSLGNTIEVEDLLKELGADVCRWWVSSTNTDNDIKVDMGLLRLAGEEYRKVRNTLRFLLSNLYDFDPAAHAHTFGDQDAASLDAWVLGELNKLIATVVGCYERYEFPGVSRALFNFCNDTLSAVYLAATKDRLYCDRPDSPRRRRTQTALWHSTSALVRLAAPVLPHTAYEAWLALHGGLADSVHLATFPKPVSVTVAPEWAQLLAERPAMLKALEEARASRGIDNPLDMGLTWPRKPFLAGFDPVDLADLCLISRFALGPADSSPAVADLRSEPRCDRSWKRDGTVQPRADGGLLSDRDAAALGV